MIVRQAHFIRERAYIAVALTHFFVDTLNNGRNLLVAFLAISLGLTNAEVGIALLLYNVGNALSQPLFGWLADRIGARLLVVGGIGWMILFYVIASLASDWVALISLTVASIGSGAFHPTGTMVASQTSQTQRSQATAVFFMAGQLGLFMGPLLTGILLARYGRTGYILLPLLSLIAFISGWQWITDKNRAHSHQGTKKQQVAVETAARPARFWRRAILLSMLILTSYTTSIGAITFTPKLFAELNYDPSYVGLLAGLLTMGSAVGGVVGGSLADRFQGKYVIMFGLLASAIPLYLYVPAQGAMQAIWLLIAGFFNGMPHTILVISVQFLFPKRRAMASGIALGFMFFSGSVGSFFLGLVADKVGLAVALQGTAVLPIIAAIIAYFLPKNEAS
ncbi:MAG: MFS transporter [Chloroflexi bacterium]|nr:MFS transporter [Chloroflexota bacterium]